jgi:hypothetical protein
MAIDIQTIRDGKIARTSHIENWLSALGQLRAKIRRPEVYDDLRTCQTIEGATGSPPVAP